MDEDVDEGNASESSETLYEIHHSPELGRYLVAVRDIKAREIIIREDPLMSGPSDRGPKDIPVCLGCSCVMYEEPFNRCTTCRWPVCNVDCEKLAAHSSNECKIFQRNHVRYPPPYGWPLLSRTVFILRCLLLKIGKPRQWARLMSMSDNGEIRRCKPKCIYSDRQILENFKTFSPPNEDKEMGGGGSEASDDGGGGGFPEAEVIRINGIIDTNAHAFPLKVNGATTTICNLYSRTSLMAHSCIPNASWSPDKSLSSLTLTIRANLPISKGSMISVAYDEGQLLVCTLKRLIPNEINGMFVCKCERCLDPTELSTYIGALKCPQCEQGYLLPMDPVDSFSNWKCDNSSAAPVVNGDGEEISPCCNLVLDDESVIDIIQDAESMCGYEKMNLGSVSSPPPPSQNSDDMTVDDPSEEDETLELLKEFVRDYSGSILHPNHYILQEVTVRILRREYEKGLSSLSDSDLIFFLERCERLLGIADVLTPGFCEYRAFLQFHFSQGLLNMERRYAPDIELMLEGYEKKRKRAGANASVPRDKNGGKRDNNKNGGEGEDEEEDGKSKTKQNQLQLEQSAGVDGDNDHTDDMIFSKRAMEMKECSPSSSVTEEYKNHSKNLTRIKEMLTFLLGFFEEINSSHKLLEPIRETLLETEIRLKIMES